MTAETLMQKALNNEIDWADTIPNAFNFMCELKDDDARERIYNSIYDIYEVKRRLKPRSFRSRMFK